jgi:outer membrane translocation and assembly module TamA
MTISANFENLGLIPDYISASQTKRITYNYLTFNYLNELNTLDSKYFPRRGTQFHISANVSSLLNGSIKTLTLRQTYNEGNPGDFQFKRSYSLVSGLQQYLSASRKLTFMIGGDFLFTYTTDSILSPAFTFFLGGQDITTDKSIPMTGFHSNEIPVEKLFRLALDADFAVSDKIHFALLTNIGMAQETASRSQWSLLGGYGLQFGYMSFIGPVRVGIMQGLSSGERYFNSVKGFISIGFSF